MAKELQWEFVSTGGGPDDGVNNPMLQHFTGNYNYHLPREIIQNSLDAKREGSTDPVVVEFKLENFAKEDFPGHKEMLEVLNSCKKYYPASDKQAQDFIKNALDHIKAEKIPFLKISDFNTKGLNGNDDDKKGGWYNLVKSRGSSSKGEGEGGSFGIGKGAPFAASNLRIVFYSTKTEKGFSKFQGMAELVSHEKENDVKRGVGSFGFGQGSVTNPIHIPEKFRRKETGTDIFIAGYKNEKGWQDNLIQSILRNFWYAIYKKDLIVKVEAIEISSATLDQLFTKHFLTEKFKDYVKPIGNPLQYFLAVKKGKHFEKKLPTLGNVSFYFHQTEEHLNYAAMLRKSHMVIYSKRYNFPGNYAAVFICDDEKGNRELRKMEPPAHDEWIPERNPEKGKKAMEEITAFIRECLDSMKITKNAGIIDIPDLYKYLPYDDGAENEVSEGIAQYTGQESETESSKLIQKKEVFQEPVAINPFKVSIINKPDTGTGTEGSGGGNGRGGGGGGTGGGGGARKSFKKDQVTSRSFIINKTGNSFEYKVILKSTIKDKCNLKLIAVGEEGSEKIKITDVTDSEGGTYHFNMNNIHGVSLSNTQSTSLNIKVSSPFKYSLKIEAYAVQ